MGGCVSQTPEERDALRKSSAIDRQLRMDSKDFENTIKILLLGKPMPAGVYLCESAILQDWGTFGTRFITVLFFVVIQ